MHGAPPAPAFAPLPSEVQTPTGDARPVVMACPICESRRLHYAFSHQGYRVVRCADCSFMLLNPQPSDAELSTVYGASYFLGEDTPQGRAEVSEMKAATARRYLHQIRRYRGATGGHLLEVGCGQATSSSRRSATATRSPGWRSRLPRRSRPGVG